MTSKASHCVAMSMSTSAPGSVFLSVSTSFRATSCTASNPCLRQGNENTEMLTGGLYIANCPTSRLCSKPSCVKTQQKNMLLLGKLLCLLIYRVFFACPSLGKQQNWWQKSVASLPPPLSYPTPRQSPTDESCAEGPDVAGVHGGGDAFADVLPVGVSRFRAQQVRPACLARHLHSALLCESGRIVEYLMVFMQQLIYL